MFDVTINSKNFNIVTDDARVVVALLEGLRVRIYDLEKRIQQKSTDVKKIEKEIEELKEVLDQFYKQINGQVFTKINEK